MVAGFQAWTDSGSIQITENLVNPVLVASGNATTVTNTIPGAPLIVSNVQISYTLPSSANYPMVALRPSDQTVFHGVNKSGLTWTWYFLSMQAVGTSIPYWIFDKKDVITESKLFEIYNSSGTRVFSLAEKPLRIRDVMSGTMGGTALWTSVRTFESGRTYAAMPCRWSEQAIYRSRPDETEIYGLGFQGSTDGLTLSNTQLVNVSGNSTPSPFTAYQVVAIDVTNY